MNKLTITKAALITAFLFFSCLHVFSQQQSNAIAQVNIASPNASALGKFVDIPVNYHTGIPSIGVPIYTVKSGSLQLPISLSYHAGGLKVQEQASWVGAGWALNAGGVITRTVRGTPDERMASSTFQKFGYLSDSGVLNYMFKNENGTPRTLFVTGEEFAQGRHDGEADLFFFNFNGYSGKFYINDDRTPVLFPEQDIKIEYDYTPGTWTGGPGAYAQSGRSIEGFTITTPDGTKYYFGMAGGSSPTLPNVQPIEVVSIYTLNSGSTFSRSISSWYLNRIVSADGNSSIYLSYTRDSYAYCIANASNPTGNFSGDYNTYDLVKNLMDGVKLSKISFATGTVDFIAGAARQDLSGWNQGAILSINDAVNTISPSLAAIQISDNSPTGFCKKFTLSQSYFTDNTTPLPAFLSGITLTADKKRLKLDSLKESSCDGSITNPPYRFEYNTELVPRTVCFNYDHWGFINGAANTDLLPSLTKNGAAYIATTNNRESGWPAMRAGTLWKMVFPTKGFNSYSYEPNTFQVNGVEDTVGGLRVKTTVQSDSANFISNNQTSYIYTDYTGFSSGILYSVPRYIQKVRSDILYKTNAWAGTTEFGCFPTTFPIYSRNSLQPMATTQGSHIGYGEVKVSRILGGYTIYRYYGTDTWQADHTKVAVTNYDDVGGGTYGSCSLSIPNFPAAPLPNDFKRGELKYEGQFDVNGVVLTEKDFFHDYQENPVTVPGYIFSSLVTSGGSNNMGTFYEMKTAKKIYDKVVTRTYGITGQPYTQTIDETFYGSNYHHQATKTISLNSLSQPLEKRIKYVQDFIVPTVTNTACNYAAYTSAVAGFPGNYLSLLSGCESYTGVERNVCIGTIWYMNYIKDVSIARQAYISCRRNNYDPKIPSNTYQVTHDTAKARANAELKPILWMQDVYMNSPVETSDWKNGKLLGATYIKYSNLKNDATGIYPDKTQQIDLVASSASFTAATVAGDNISISKDSRYKDGSLFDFNKGNPISVVSRDGIPASYDWGYAEKFPVVKIVNAANKYKEAILPGLVNNGFNFYIGSSLPGSGNLNADFTQSETGSITISIPSGMPPGAQATASYTLTGPSATYNRNGTLCAAGSGGASCSATPYTITFTNMAPGNYHLFGYVNTSFPSYQFNYSLNYNYRGLVLTSGGLKEYFYEGFEEDGSAASGFAHSGGRYRAGSYTCGFTKPNTRNYTVQWWNYSATKWNFNQQTYTNYMVLTGPVDDVRIFPSDAQMSTYTYVPLYGITSQTDPNGKTMYYDYDKMGRLKNMRDNNRNIRQNYFYNYGLAPAALPAILSFGATNNAAVQFDIQLTSKASGQVFTYVANAGSNPSLGSIPPDVYDVYISRKSGTSSYIFTMCTFSASGANTTFYNVQIGAGSCNSITIN